MASALEVRPSEDVHQFFGQFRRNHFGSQANDIGVIMLARHCGHVFVENLRGPDAVKFVGGHANACTGAANQQTHLRAAFLQGVPHSHGIVRVIRGFAGVSAEIHDAHALVFQMFLEDFLQLKPCMIGTNGKFHRFPIAGTRRKHAVLFHKSKNRGNALFNLVAAVQIYIIRTADGIADVFFKNIQGVVKFAEQKSLLGCFGIKQENRVHMAVGHPENKIRFLHQFGSQLPAALARDINSQFPCRQNRVMAGGLTIHRANPGGNHPDVIATFHGVAEDAFRQWTAANVTRANE